MEKRRMRFSGSHLRILVSITVYVVLIGVFMLVAPEAFLGYRIYMTFLAVIPFGLILGLGMTYVAVSGEIDLSFPAVMCFSAYVFAFTLSNTGSSILAFLACLISGTIAGAINGVVVAKTRIPSIIATLGTQFLWMGIVLVLSRGMTIKIPFVRDLLIWDIFVARIGGIVPTQSLWAFGIAILLGLVLNKHRFGDNVIFLGDNREAARVLGINTNRVIIQVFGLMGLLSAFAGMLVTIDFATWYPVVGRSYLLPVFAAVFLGGTQMTGGEGSILGTVIGAFLLGSMTSGIVAAGVSLDGHRYFLYKFPWHRFQQLQIVYTIKLSQYHEA